MSQTETISLALLEAYSDANLNKISQNLLLLYKDQEYEKLNIISEMISEWVEISIDEDGKGFAKIISLYHPDRGEYYRNLIIESARKDDVMTLGKFKHIFVIQDIEEIAANIESYEDIDYHPEYQWDINASGFTYTEEKRRKKHSKTRRNKINGYSFYEAIQIRQYGDTYTSFPTYYLEDMDEVELSESDIDDLDGVEYCIHTISMDLSGNRITDLSPLSGLYTLQELNLANNLLSYIDALSNLEQLRSLDLSNNSINDISPLFEIDSLEYIDLTGNPISANQLDLLMEKGITVDYGID